MLRRWVLTTAGFSRGGASFFALRRRLINARGFLLRPAHTHQESTSIIFGMYSRHMENQLITSTNNFYIPNPVPSNDRYIHVRAIRTRTYT